MERWEIIVAIVGAVLGSNGLWALISRLIDKKSKSNKLLLGLAYDRIVTLCDEYLERGHITTDEYENLLKYLYKPYKDNGGDGVADVKMDQITILMKEGVHK